MLGGKYAIMTSCRMEDVLSGKTVLVRYLAPSSLTFCSTWARV
jgi:hypothetical protein